MAMGEKIGRKGPAADLGAHKSSEPLKFEPQKCIKSFPPNCSPILREHKWNIHWKGEKGKDNLNLNGQGESCLNPLGKEKP
jgi:hypothetical protein